MASETLELISLPRVLVLLVTRFDIISSTCKLKNRLEVSEEFALCCGTDGSIRQQLQHSGTTSVTSVTSLDTSDTSIRISSRSKASSNIGKNGYMLFYVKS
ncbi:hypothetical protein G5714_012131 [Onychostoma macrolepis]|uniref:Uncharacterized protein n=1 Tax=Onychostoma macrolepis TaxID=369639 RepID=A0A7J6CKB4_9TELE|nr:hypothetical protein G5714_012131 [Onychostoma macrolepis]